MRAKGAIYGTKDAGRQWWLYLRATLVELGWRESLYEPCLFMLRGPAGELIGLLCTHVDDLFITGNGEEFEANLETLKNKVYLSVTIGEFRYCGKRVRQDLVTYEIKIGQSEAIEAMDFIHIEPYRRKKMEAPLNPEEISGLRSGVGSLGWVARQTRADLAVHASLGAQAMSGPRIKHIVEVNKAIKMAKDDKDFELTFSPDVSWEDGIIFGCGDSSHGNVDDIELGEKVKSQCGFIIGLASKELEDGAKAPIHALEWASATIKRVCRGSLPAECNGFLTTAESAEFLKHVMEEIQNPSYSALEFDSLTDGKRVLLMTDAGGLSSSLDKDGGQPADKRVRILMAQIRQLLGYDQVRSSDQEWTTIVKWIDTKVMLADALTKVEAERGFLLQCLAEGRWSIAQTEEMLEQKKLISDARRARRSQERARRKVPIWTNPDEYYYDDFPR